MIFIPKERALPKSISASAMLQYNNSSLNTCLASFFFCLAILLAITFFLFVSHMSYIANHHMNLTSLYKLILKHYRVNKVT